MRPFSCLFFFFSFFFPPLDGRVRLLVLGVFNVRTAVHVFGARVYRILLATLRHLLVDDTRVLVFLVVLVAGSDVRLASGADVTRSLLIAATPRCNKQRHDRSRQMCVCGYSTFFSSLFFPLPFFLSFLYERFCEIAVRVDYRTPFILSTNRYCPGVYLSYDVFLYVSHG